MSGVAACCNIELLKKASPDGSYAVVRQTHSLSM